MGALSRRARHTAPHWKESLVRSLKGYRNFGPDLDRPDMFFDPFDWPNGSILERADRRYELLPGNVSARVLDNRLCSTSDTNGPAYYFKAPGAVYSYDQEVTVWYNDDSGSWHYPTLHGGVYSAKWVWNATYFFRTGWADWGQANEPTDPWPRVQMLRLRSRMVGSNLRLECFTNNGMYYSVDDPSPPDPGPPGWIGYQNFSQTRVRLFAFATNSRVAGRFNGSPSKGRL